ncbi:MAG: ABC transporter permease [Chitinophagaceae bacterium]|nr:ABC transporter permease [Oligoflexus sp.]
MFKATAIIFRHELRDFTRDRSTLKTMFLLLIFMPIMFSYIIGNVENLVQGEREKEKRVGVVDSLAVRDLSPFLKQQGITLIPVTNHAKDTFRSQKLNAVINETPNNELDSPDHLTANLELWTSGTNEKVLADAHYVGALIQSYGQGFGKRQLILRGIAPILTDPIQVEIKSLSEDSRSGFATLDLLVSLFGMALFYSTLHLAVDTTAGERERLTLESLFYTAAPRSALVFGKWALVALMIFTANWLVGTVFWALGEFSIFQNLLGRTETFAYSKLLWGLLIFLPICPTIAAMQIMIGSLSQSVKQAQAFNGISGILSLPLSFLIFVEQIKPLVWVPIFGQGLAFRSLLHGEDFEWLPLLVSEASTLALGALMLGLILHRFHQEKMVYSGG